MSEFYPDFKRAQGDFHKNRRRAGWKCKLGNYHEGSCPLLPIWYRHPILWWRIT